MPGQEHGGIPAAVRWLEATELKLPVVGLIVLKEIFGKQFIHGGGLRRMLPEHKNKSEMGTYRLIKMRGWRRPISFALEKSFASISECSLRPEVSLSEIGLSWVST